MDPNPLLLVTATLAFISTEAGAQASFDVSLLKGTWAESSDDKYACRPDNVHQHFEVSSDRSTLIFKNDRKWRNSSGQELEEYSATIVREGPNVLVIRYGPELKDIPDEFREWEMRFIGPGTYRWRASSWPIGSYNGVVGVKCAPE
jgi:hypothetical protein